MKVKVENHPDAMVTGAVTFANGRVYVPVASIEEGTAVIPTYECCTFRGSIVSLDAVTGQTIWKTFTIADAAQPTIKTETGTQLWGPSGVGVWSTPVLEPDRNRMYIAVGDNYSNPATSNSDSIMALQMDTAPFSGRRRRSRATPGTAAASKIPQRGTRELPERTRSRLRLRQRARSGDARQRETRAAGGTEVGDACTALIQTPATFSGRREWGMAACSAASSGASRPTTRARTSRSQTSRRRPAKPEAS